MHTDIYSMSRLVDLSLKKDYETFAHEILGCLDNYYEIRRVLSVTKNIEPISVINGCVFIVKDLEKLILCVAIRSTKYEVRSTKYEVRSTKYEVWLRRHQG